MTSLEEIFEQIQEDPSTKVDPDWVDNWLHAIGNKTQEYHYLENKSIKDIDQEKEEVLKRFIQQKDKWSKSLSMYRCVHDLQDLRLGNHIRWIREKPLGTFSLTNGGILVQIKFLNNGTYLVCKNFGKFMQYELDKCITFQKISVEEWVILMANVSYMRS